MPSVSVIVPVYKVEPYLRQCVDSILAQTFSDFELILVDDGSPDNCGAICDEYAEKDARIHVIHQQNGGLSAARNAGIDVAKGKFLTFVDSDDIVKTKYLESLYDMIESYDAEIACCGMCDFVDNVAPAVDCYNDKKEHTYRGPDAALEQYAERSVVRVSACGKLYSADLYKNVRFPEGMLHEDQATTPIVLFNASRVVAFDTPLYCYRLREQSIMHSRFSAKRYDDIVAVDKCICYFKNKDAEELVKAAVCRKNELMAVYSLLARKDGVYSEVPKEYRISEHRALKWLRKNLSDDKYTYQLAKVHPNWLRPHAYWRKIKKILHIPCK